MLTMLGWLLGCGGLCGGLSAGLCVGQAEAAAPSGMLRLDARLDGRLVGDERLVIDPARAAEVMITVSNGSGDPVRVTTVRLTGAALGLTLFGYDTAVAFDVQPGATVTWSFPLDTAGLDLQVTGLLPAAVRLLGPDGAVLAEVGGTADVRGAVWSVYGVFGIAVVIVTLLAWASVLVALARRQLPPGGWWRAGWFLPAGIGTGVSAVVVLSMLRLVSPTPAVQIMLVLACSAAAAVLGYLVPRPYLDTARGRHAADRFAKHDRHGWYDDADTVEFDKHGTRRIGDDRAHGGAPRAARHRGDLADDLLASPDIAAR